jgi:predicted nucleotidyltransferase component of viral defense system
MAFREIYRRQAGLLIRTLPFVAAEKCFALKGGTAINLFIRDMPRLSVDIDLTYVPIEPRETSLLAVEAALQRIAQQVRAKMKEARVNEGRLQPEGKVTKLIVRAHDIQTTIEVTPVIRGCVYEPELRAVSAAVEEAFGFAEMSVVSFADLYAGKIVAALDRQHPRDLFDARDLLAHEGIDDLLRRAFIVYLLSHTRPMAEVLAARRKDISQDYARAFDGMTEEPIALEELEQAREALIESIVGKMPDAHRKFLISFERGKPDWGLLGLPEAANLPAVKWRQQKLDELSGEKRAALVAQLERVLSD